MSNKINIYEEVTKKIISQLKDNIIPWKKPWLGYEEIGCGAYNRVSGKPYSLLNQFLLDKPGEWMTFNQCKQAGGHIKKGEKSSIVVFWKMLSYDANPEAEEKVDEKKHSFPYLKYYSVFHIDQTEGLTPKKYENPSTIDNGNFNSGKEKIDKILNDYFQRENIAVEEKGLSAYYSIQQDKIIMPQKSNFYTSDGYYSTLSHEAIHSTGTKDRLNRKGFESDLEIHRSKEEIIAEIGTSFLSVISGFNNDDVEKNNIAYIQSWIQMLENDSKIIISASNKAEQAVKFILGKNL